MYGFLEGKLEHLSPSKTFLNVNGVGYELNISLYTYEVIKDLEEVRLYTHLQVREDAWVLYGFYDLKEKDIFLQLVSVSGVGAATSRVIISSIHYIEIAKIIANGDNKTLEKVKGIGAKTAQRIILDLRGKVILDNHYDDAKINISSHNTIKDDALNALVSLGIPKNNAESAIAKVAQEENIDVLKVEQLIKLALKKL
jgi:Holliday junction DNA helicase RuvA